MTNNEQTPGGNTTTAGAVEMARRIADETSPRTNIEDVLEAALNGAAYRSALAAIIETRTDIVAWLRTEWGMLPEALDFADMIERGDHLKGQKP